MAGKRRDSSYRNKLYEDSSAAWGIVVVVGLVVAVIVVVLVMVSSNLD